ncbi:MAG: DUF3168 domain-containing protein [Planctomycetota bacterium]
MIEGVVYNWLSGASAVTNVVADRIHHEQKPQDEREASIVIGEADIEPIHSHVGDAGWSRGRLRINVFADDKAMANSLANACRAVVDNQRGVTVNSVKVGRFEVVRVASIPREPQPGKQRQVFGYLLDCDFITIE